MRSWCQADRLGSRQPRPRVTLPCEFVENVLRACSARSIRFARRCGAAGPPDVTTERLRPARPPSSHAPVFHFRVTAGRSHIPEAIIVSVRLHRVTSFAKPTAGVRSMVWREGMCLARCPAAGTGCHLNALPTREGCECFAHAAIVQRGALQRAQCVRLDVARSHAGGITRGDRRIPLVFPWRPIPLPVGYQGRCHP